MSAACASGAWWVRAKPLQWWCSPTCSPPQASSARVFRRFCPRCWCNSARHRWPRCLRERSLVQPRLVRASSKRDGWRDIIHSCPRAFTPNIQASEPRFWAANSSLLPNTRGRPCMLLTVGMGIRKSWDRLECCQPRSYYPGQITHRENFFEHHALSAQSSTADRPDRRETTPSSSCFAAATSGPRTRTSGPPTDGEGGLICRLRQPSSTFRTT